MTNEVFLKMREESTRIRHKMSDEKSKAYTRGSDDRLNNFKELARFLNLPGVTDKIILAVHYGKHDLAFYHWLATGEESSEGMESTLDDLQNYLDLARARLRDGGCDSHMGRDRR